MNGISGALANWLAERLETTWKRLGYAWFDGPMNLNIFGIRADSTEPGKFDDAIGVAYQVRRDLGWRIESWRATTDPSTHYLEDPINPAGTAILVPGQYRGAYKLGKHRGRPALVQHGAPVKVWRDNNLDQILDWRGSNEHETPGWYGINIHDATGPDDRVSAGCQVFADKHDLERLLDLAQASEQHYGERFTYTLIEAGDLDD
jgi:hypothetical protein